MSGSTPPSSKQHAVKVLDARLAKAVEPSIVRVEKTLAGFERQAAELGAQRTVAAAGRSTSGQGG